MQKYWHDAGVEDEAQEYGKTDHSPLVGGKVEAHKLDEWLRNEDENIVDDKDHKAAYEGIVVFEAF